MKVTKKLKAQFKIITTLCITLFGGITIWSCSQDELDENGQPVYRYTAEEIATLKTLAEEYEFPTKDLVFKSDTELPTIKEWEELFQVAYGIKQNLASQLDTVTIGKDIIHLRVIGNKKTFKRAYSGAMEYNGKYSETFRVNNPIPLTCNNNFAYIDITVQVINASPTDPTNHKDPSGSTNKSIIVSASMTLSSALSGAGYEVESLNCNWNWRGSTTIEVKISYKINNNQMHLVKPFTGEETYSINAASIIHS